MASGNRCPHCTQLCRQILHRWARGRTTINIKLRYTILPPEECYRLLSTSVIPGALLQKPHIIFYRSVNAVLYIEYGLIHVTPVVCSLVTSYFARLLFPESIKVSKRYALSIQVHFAFLLYSLLTINFILLLPTDCKVSYYHSVSPYFSNWRIISLPDTSTAVWQCLCYWIFNKLIIFLCINKLRQ